MESLTRLAAGPQIAQCTNIVKLAHSEVDELAHSLTYAMDGVPGALVLLGHHEAAARAVEAQNHAAAALRSLREAVAKWN